MALAKVSVGEVDLDLCTAKQTDAKSGNRISRALASKGFCVINPPVEEEHLKGVLLDISGIDRISGRFHQPSAQLVEGYLGLHGSARIAELKDVPTELQPVSSEGTHISYFDAEMSKFVYMLSPHLPRLQIDSMRRTLSTLHEAGVPGGDGPPLTPEECQRAIGVFSTARLMGITCLGPSEGVLELQPFDDESNSYKVKMPVGTVVILRADAMAHRFSSAAKCFCMTTFYLERSNSSKHTLFENMEGRTPCCKGLEDWAEQKMAEYGEAFPEDQMQMSIPREWERKLNHESFTGQRISIRSASAKQPSTWQIDDWTSSFLVAPDYVIEIPLMRFNILDCYDPDPSSWQYGQRSNCKHCTFVEGAELFDNAIFRLSKNEAGGMDVGHRMILECGYDALLKDGFKIKTIMNSRGGVYVVNAGANEWGFAEKQTSYTGVCGGGGSIACGRFSFTHGMKGPCISCDVEGASGLTVIQQCSVNLIRTGNWAPIPYGVCMGYSVVLTPHWHHWFTASGWLCARGRCFAFESCADGYARGETAMAMVLKALTDVIDDEVVLTDDGNMLGSVAATNVNQNGRSSSITAPSVSSLQEVTADCCRMAEISPLDVDSFEAYTGCKIMEDGVEATSTVSALRQIGMKDMDQATPVAFQLMSTSTAALIESHGLAQVLKVCHGASIGVCHPNLHMRILNPYLPEALERDDCATGIITDSAVEYNLESSYTGILNRSKQGTNVCSLVWGQMKDEVSKPFSGAKFEHEKILYWPEGGGSMESSQVASRGYHIIGSWNSWTPEPMESMGNSIYATTVTLGPNRWERFQICLDSDKDKVLHPGASWAEKGVKVLGPDPCLSNLSWVIDARSTVSVPSGDGMVLELANPSVDDVGEPGDQYRVVLSVQGKWRTVDWEKLEGEPGPCVDEGAYYVSGTWNDGALEEMTSDGNGTHTVEVTLSRYGGMFTIVRNRDFGQVLFPETPFATNSDTIAGPEPGSGHCWVIEGGAGDKFEIKFSRIAATDEKTISWSKVGTGEVAEEALALVARPEFYIRGSWDDMCRMMWTGDFYQLILELGPSATASFDLLLSGDVSKVFFPSVENAGPHERHSVMGPDFSFGGAQWSIGTNKADDAAPGKRYQIRLRVDDDEGFRPTRVDWVPMSGGVELIDDLRGRGFFAVGF